MFISPEQTRSKWKSRSLLLLLYNYQSVWLPCQQSLCPINWTNQSDLSSIFRSVSGNQWVYTDTEAEATLWSLAVPWFIALSKRLNWSVSWCSLHCIQTRLPAHRPDELFHQGLFFFFFWAPIVTNSASLETLVALVHEFQLKETYKEQTLLPQLWWIMTVFIYRWRWMAGQRTTQCLWFWLQHNNLRDFWWNQWLPSLHQEQGKINHLFLLFGWTTSDQV